jgi:hypothetical protein
MCGSLPFQSQGNRENTFFWHFLKKQYFLKSKTKKLAPLNFF